MIFDALTIKALYLSAYPEGSEDVKNFNTDVIVLVEEEEEEGDKRTVKYVASFFTYANLFELQSQNIKTGECLNGKYFYAKNMVLIDECSMENVKTVVQHLVEEGEFREAFRRI